MSELSFDVRLDHDTAVVAVAGEVDMATASQLDEYLCAHADRHVIVDLSKVPFLDSSGLGALVHARTVLGENGRTLRVTGEQANVKTVLESTGLLAILHGEDGKSASRT